MKRSKRSLKKLDELRNDPDVELYALDEVLFQLHGSICKMWIPKDEKNPRIFLHPTRKTIGFYGAVRLRDGRLFSYRPDGRFDGQSFLAFLKSLRMRTARCKKKIVLLADNAKYHHSKIISDWIEPLDDKFTLLFLPPYSPELNPIERVWKLTRRTTIHNRYFNNLDELTYAVEDLFWTWSTSNIILTRLCA